MLTKIEASKPLRWQRVKYSSLTRQIDVFRETFLFLFFLWWDNIRQDVEPETRRRRARWLVSKMLDLGPTFIKVGQSLSTRIDLLPLEYVQELSGLQDRVPAFSADEAIAVVEEELGKSLFTIYRDFDLKPLAAASLGQVHKARLHTGEDVVVKVQRRGLRELFDLDKVVCFKLIKILRHYFQWMRKYDLDGIFKEFFVVLYQEIDYVQEGKNADRFRANFADNPRIVVPKVYWEYSSARVLTLEYVPGIKVDDVRELEARGLDPKEINQLGIRCYLQQFLEDGFFHADPHPGNLAVTPQGNLIFYDYGMMSEVPSLDRERMVKTFFAVLRKDSNQVIDTLTSMGLIEPVDDMAPVKRLMKFLLDKFTEKPVDLRALEEIKGEVYAIFEKQPFRLPSKMTYLLKSLSTLDGVARILDPDYNFSAAAQPFIKSLALARSRGNVLGEIVKQARDYISYRLNQPSGTELLLRRLEERMERGEFVLRVQSADSDRTLKRINLAVKCLIYACITGFMLLSGAILLVGGNGTYAGWAIVVLVLAGFFFISLLRSLLTLSLREKLDRLAEK